MELKILHFYPDLMSLYGSYANVSILKRTLEKMGNTVTVERVELGGDADLTHADFVYMGAGTERAQKAALLYFSKLRDAVKAAADAGVTMLFAGNSMELLGKTITDDAGKVYEGLGLADFTAVQNKKRFVEDVYGHTDPLPRTAVVGFINRWSRHHRRGDAAAGFHGHGPRQRGTLRPGGISQGQRIRQSAHRPHSGKEPGAAEGHGPGHLPSPGRDLPGDPGGSIHGRGLGHHSGAVEGPLHEIKEKSTAEAVLFCILTVQFTIPRTGPGSRWLCGAHPRSRCHPPCCQGPPWYRRNPHGTCCSDFPR